MVTYNKIISFAAVLVALTACSKVDPVGVLIGKSSVEDRVKQSFAFYKEDEKEFFIDATGEDSYSFLVVADSHTMTDTRRLKTFCDEVANNKAVNYQMCMHLGDLAETQPEYYNAVEELFSQYKDKKKYPNFRFYPVVGNHDITRNGWSLFNTIFGTSTYAVLVYVGSNDIDLHIFLDSACGSLGNLQMEYLDELLTLKQGYKMRNCFVYTHNNIFRPKSFSFASDFPREELYTLLNKFSENEVDCVFCGHIHEHGENDFGGVHYITLDAFGERNSPDRGEMIRVTCTKSGEIKYETIYAQ